MSKTAIFGAIFKKTGDKLVYVKPVDEARYQLFVDSLEEGMLVHSFFDASEDNGTLAQLAKIKACIRELAKETGHTFEEMQNEIKKSSGLDGRSFGDCSSSDLGLAIQTIIERGDFLKINCR